MGKPEVFLCFSLTFEGFLVSEGFKIMKISENTDRGGKERLGEQENKANRAFTATESPKGARLSLTGEHAS